MIQLIFDYTDAATDMGVLASCLSALPSPTASTWRVFRRVLTFVADDIEGALRHQHRRHGWEGNKSVHPGGGAIFAAAGAVCAELFRIIPTRCSWCCSR